MILAYLLYLAAIVLYVVSIHYRLERHSLRSYLQTQMRWSAKTFGKGMRTTGTIEHIKHELEEIEKDPADLMEWIDVMMLAMDGYWRHGGTPKTLARDLFRKAAEVRQREYPANVREDEAAEHIRVGRVTRLVGLECPRCGLTVEPLDGMLICPSCTRCGEDIANFRTIADVQVSR